MSRECSILGHDSLVSCAILSSMQFGHYDLTSFIYFCNCKYDENTLKLY